MQLATFLVSTDVSRNRQNASTVSTGSSVIYSTCSFICEQWRLVTKDYAWECLYDKNWTTVKFTSPHLTARHQQGSTNAMRPGARATEFRTPAPNTIICESAARNLLHLTLLAPRILTWPPDFQITCALIRTFKRPRCSRHFAYMQLLTYDQQRLVIRIRNVTPSWQRLNKHINVAWVMSYVPCGCHTTHNVQLTSLLFLSPIYDG